MLFCRTDFAVEVPETKVYEAYRGTSVESIPKVLDEGAGNEPGDPEKGKMLTADEAHD